MLTGATIVVGALLAATDAVVAMRENAINVRWDLRLRSDSHGSSGLQPWSAAAVSIPPLVYTAKGVGALRVSHRVHRVNPLSETGSV